MSRLASFGWVALLMLGCKRSDAPARVVPVASSTPDAAAVLAPIVSAAPSPSSVAPAATLPPLEPVATSNAVHHAAAAKTTTTSKREPMRACCDALRKQSQPASAQAAALCDGVVAAFDESAAAPQLEQMVRPILLDTPLPDACKGL